MGARAQTDSEMLAPLVTDRGYRNVYRKGEGWVAKVKRAGVLQLLPGSRSSTPRGAALHVAAWYAREYGPRWPEVARGRRVTPWVVRRSTRHGGYVACVWVMGQREEVADLRRLRGGRWAATDRLAAWPTAAEARAGVRLYLRRRYGLFAEVVLWRPRPAQSRAR